MLLSGFLTIFTLKTLALIAAGTVLGIIFGAIPGITVTMGVALFLPITFGMDPLQGICLLIALYIGGTSGGLISAILLKIPGTPASIATTFDGYPMAMRGEAGKALGAGIVFSFLGGMFSVVALMLLAPTLASVALEFGPYEYFGLALFSLTLIAGMSGKSMLKGGISAIVGMVFAFVGMAPITGFPRFTFGFDELVDGFSLLPALIGLFAVSQILEEAMGNKREEDAAAFSFNIRGFGFTWREFKGQLSNFLISSLIGTGIGILPGLGGGICNLVAYGTVQKYSKYPEKFGSGILDGVVASETSNNASTGGAMVPLLTLGIPGDNTTAMILAGFMIHGITPGPLLFDKHSDMVYGVFAALIVSNIIMILAEFWGMRLFVHILSVPKNILLPTVGVMCVIGAYGANNRIFDIWTMFLFGVLGFILKRFAIPLGPIILGFILCPILEINFRRGLQKSDGSLLPFFTEPISCAFIIITILVCLRLAWQEWTKKKA
ncbi:MAG: tripartite tricarboxylate transporter permease, partial [Planctomycetota bacterium]|nr:tripartite tricarboxylate transporter permease [Planctomycetota bacterium]